MASSSGDGKGKRGRGRDREANYQEALRHCESLIETRKNKTRKKTVYKFHYDAKTGIRNYKTRGSYRATRRKPTSTTSTGSAVTGDLALGCSSSSSLVIGM